MDDYVLGLKKDFELAIGITVDNDYGGDYVVHYRNGYQHIIEMGEYLIATVDDYNAAADAAIAAKKAKEALENKGGKRRRRTNKKRKQRRRKNSGRH